MASKAFLVAAIDLGTTYSGWACSFKHEFDTDPTRVSTKYWIEGQLVTQKGPTCVLIRPDGKTLERFGYGAENRYADLVCEGEYGQWYFFKNFKTTLSGQGVERNLMLDDASGEKKLLAKTVFSLAIKYLKDDLIKEVERRLADGCLRDEDIHWVLTVPSIWNDAAKQFMRQAAEQAGISTDKLTIALEPEAASLYCRYLSVDNCGSDKTSLATFGPGKRYLVIDAGGSMVRITAHELTSDGKYKELGKTSEGPYGGEQVNHAFFQFLNDIIGPGPDVMSKFRDEHMDDYLELFRHFEVKKRQMKTQNYSKIRLNIPLSLPDIVEEIRNEKLRDVIQKTKYSDKVKLAGYKLQVDASIVERFFESSVESILKLVKVLLQHSSIQGVEAIVMVGGFSESPTLQEAVRNRFPSLRIIVPDEAGLAVVKGAVLFGHCPS